MPIFTPDMIDHYAQQVPTQEEVRRDWKPYGMVIGSNLADIGTTLYNLNSKGAREANPVLGNNQARLLALKGAGTVGTLLGMRALENSGHPTVAKWVGYLSSVLPSIAVIHNLNVK